MDRDAIAKELAELGRKEARHMKKLAAVQARRCALLTGLACDHGAELGLSSDVVPTVIAPKEDEGP
jgi:hypothetical protein